MLPTMKLTRTTQTTWQGRRQDGCRIAIEGFPHVRQVWQVNHGPHSEREHSYFETKEAAVRFAFQDALPCNWWEDIYIVGYPRNRAIRGQRGELLGIANS